MIVKTNERGILDHAHAMGNRYLLRDDDGASITKINEDTWRWRVVDDGWSELWFNKYLSDGSLHYVGYVQLDTANQEKGRVELWELDGSFVHMGLAIQTNETWRIAMLEDDLEGFKKYHQECLNGVQEFFNKLNTLL